MPEDDKCNHVFNYEETYCTICLKPTWQIAHDSGMDKISELEKWNQQALDNNEANAYDIGDVIKEISELKEHISELYQMNNAVIELEDQDREVLQDIISLTVPNHLKKDLLDRVEGKDGEKPSEPYTGMITGEQQIAREIYEGEKEPTEAGSARQTEFELIEKYIPPRGITCKDCMNMGKDELKIKKADLENMINVLILKRQTTFGNEMKEEYLKEERRK